MESLYWERGPCNVSVIRSTALTHATAPVDTENIHRFKLTVAPRNGERNEEVEEEEKEGATGDAPSATESVFEQLPVDGRIDIDDEEDKAEGLEAGEAAVLAKKRKAPPKPVECCITINRYRHIYCFNFEILVLSY